MKNINKSVELKEHNEKKNLPDAQMMLSSLGPCLLLVLDRRRGGGSIINSGGSSVVMGWH
jgi:hypothetical protein